MSVTKKLLEASGGGDKSKYVEDVFSTYLYDGTSADRDIVNDIDLDDKGGLVWIKERTRGTSAAAHAFTDTERGAGKVVASTRTDAEYTTTTSGSDLTSFNSNGFSLGPDQYYYKNQSSEDYVSWTFAKQEGFFDIVTYTGNGVAGRTVPHNLGSVPAVMIVKSTTNGAYNWMVYHQSLGNTNYLRLNETTQTLATAGAWNNTTPTDSEFTLGGSSVTNGNGESFVAYLFAHDAPMFGPDEDESIIKCGGYTGTGTGVPQDIDLGWEPQWLLIKSTTYPGQWCMFDSMRGLSGSADFLTRLSAQSTSAEYNTSASNYQEVGITSTGFHLTGNNFNNTNGAGQEYIYMAIRRPHKPAEEFEPDELFALYGPTVSGDNPMAVSGFPVDMGWLKKPSAVYDNYLGARLIQGKYARTNSTSAANNNSSFAFDYQDGFNRGWDIGAQAWMFRRAPGFFDVVCYEGDGQAGGQEIPHSLGTYPEMVWIKSTDQPYPWPVYCKYTHPTATNQNYRLDLSADTNRSGGSSYFPFATSPDSFPVGYAPHVNEAGASYIAFLWASVPGICDIGSYTGTGAALNIDCGFTNGARFILIKRTDSTGDWYYWDTLRGIVSGNDPYLLLNSTAAQVTNTDYIDPLSSGFTVTASAPAALNNNGGTYIYMAIA